MADNKLVKSAGEHSACAILSRHRWAVALTRDGLERTDILAVHTVTGQMVEVQVKAASHNARPTWLLGRKGLLLARSDREWFVFVLLGPKATDPARHFVVPRDHVSAATWLQHRHWEGDPTAMPGTRNTGIELARLSVKAVEGYEDRWDLLEASARDAPVLLPAFFREYAVMEWVGFPPDHPWATELPEW